MKLRKGDTIVVTAGRDAAKQGKVDRVYVKAGTVMVDGINMYKRHVKKNEQLPEGGILDLPRPIDVSKVSLLCPKCKKTTHHLSTQNACFWLMYRRRGFFCIGGV
jgi:large subunit ribosomal protein L24